MTAKIAKLEEKQVFRGLGDAGWSRVVELDDGRRFRVTVSRGNRVRIAFKPAGPGGWGFKWYGRVSEFVDLNLHAEIWHGEVGKSIGARGLLARAGLVEKGKSPREVIREARHREWLKLKHLPKIDARDYGSNWPDSSWISSTCGVAAKETEAFTLDLDAVTCGTCREKIQQAVVGGKR